MPVHPLSRLATAPGSSRSDQRTGPAAWLLQAAFAGLLGTAVWHLDRAERPAADAPAAAVAAADASVASRLGTAVVDLLMTLSTAAVERPEARADWQRPAPEGWPLWSAGPADRAPR